MINLHERCCRTRLGRTRNLLITKHTRIQLSHRGRRVYRCILLHILIDIWAVSKEKVPSNMLKCADLDHPAQTQDIIRVFALH